MESPVDESGRSRRRGVDALLGEEDRVAGGLGELLDAGSDVEGIPDQSERELASPADGAGDHKAGVDPDADPKRAAESLGDQTMNQHSGGHRSVGMISQVVRRTEDSQGAVAEELVDVPTGVG